MKTTNNTSDITLFARYKNMINTMLADGFTTYTAEELNSFVGIYENSTSWKRMNNNPYYSTRLYQSMLKELGCITPIKRGLWKINGPIPEWFGSFHINALTNTGSLRILEKSSIYWQNLPAEHKVNPWKTGVTTTTGSTAQSAQPSAEISKPAVASGSEEKYSGMEVAFAVVPRVFYGIVTPVDINIGYIKDLHFNVTVNVESPKHAFSGDDFENVEVVDSYFYITSRPDIADIAIVSMLETLIGSDECEFLMEDLIEKCKHFAVEKFNSLSIK